MNDPVNSVDLSGLDPQDPLGDPPPMPPGPIDVINPDIEVAVIDTWGRLPNDSGGQRSSGVAGTSSGPMEIERETGGGDPGEEVAHSNAQRSTKNDDDRWSLSERNTENS